MGPASRTVDVACDDHDASKPVVGQASDDAEWENADSATGGPCSCTDAERQRMEVETNTAEDVIAVDHSNGPGLLETFTAFQVKL